MALVVDSVVVDDVEGQPSLTRWEALGCTRCAEDGEMYSLVHVHPVCDPMHTQWR